MCVRLRLRQFSRLCLLLLIGVNISVVQAHEVRPAVVTIDMQEGGAFSVSADLNLEAFLSGLTAAQEKEQHADANAEGQTDALIVAYERLRALPPDELEKALRKQQGTLLKVMRVKAVGEIAGTVASKCIHLKLEKVVIPEINVLPVARNSLITLTGQLPQNSSAFTWQAAKAFGDVILRVNAGEQELYTDYLTAGTASDVIGQSEL